MHRCEALKDMSQDFRVGSKGLGSVRFAVFGLGSQEYDEEWCVPALEIHDQFLAMGALPLAPPARGATPFPDSFLFRSFAFHFV